LAEMLMALIHFKPKLLYSDLSTPEIDWCNSVSSFLFSHYSCAQNSCILLLFRLALMFRHLMVLLEYFRSVCLRLSAETIWRICRAEARFKHREKNPTNQSVWAWP